MFFVWNNGNVDNVGWTGFTWNGEFLGYTLFVIYVLVVVREDVEGS